MKAVSRDDEAFRALAEGMLRGQGRAAPRPMRKTVERKPKAKAELPPAREAAVDWPEIEHVSVRIEDRNAALRASKTREATAKEKALRPKTLTRTVNVESPYGRATNGVDRVEKILDTIDLLLRARQIDRDQEAAARMVKDAAAMAPGNIRCALSAGEGGAGPGSRSPTEGQLWAGGILNDVRKVLGELDSLVVLRICGAGFSIEDTARMMFAIIDGIRVSARQREHVGMRLRMALAVLAKHWQIGTRRPKVGIGSANNRSAKARNDEFVLRDFSTKHVPEKKGEGIGKLAHGNSAEIEAQRERERLLGEREARRARWRTKKLA